jgi:hypothetical protein
MFRLDKFLKKHKAFKFIESGCDLIFHGMYRRYWNISFNE